MTSVNQKIKYFLRSHKYQRIRILVLLVLSVAVVFTIITGLIKPAVSMTGDLTCTVEEHIHTDECYADVLVCGLNESPMHYHDENCYERKNVLVCSITDESHIHTDECYESKEVLICNLTEGEGHTHTDKCYEHKLICTKPEHIHSESCYEQAEESAQLSDEESEYILMADFSNTLSAENVTYLSGTEIDTNVSVNFGELISKVSYKETSSSSIDENIKPVKFTVNYTLPSNTLMQVNDNKQIYYKLPDNVIITDAHNGPVKENGIQTGTYQITNDGYIIIDFDANYVKDGSSEITGDISFAANVKRTDSSADKETVTMGNVSVDIDFLTITENKSDLSVEKSNSGYNKDSKTISYNIDISSVNGSGDGDITVTDYLADADSSLIKLNLTDGQTVEVTKTHTDNTTETVTANVSVGADGKVTLSGLAALSAGEKYSFGYSAQLTPGDKATVINVNNKISVTNGTLTAEDDDYLSVATGCILTKSGTYNDKTDNIEWTIKVLNPYGIDINGYTVTDQMLSQTVPGTLKVLDPSWNVVEGAGTLDTTNNTFTFSSLTGTEYRLVYQTKSPDHGKTISNKAALKDDTGTSVNEDIGHAYVGSDRQYISKGGYSKGFDSSGNVKIGWSVSLRFQEGDFAGKTYTDTMTTDKTEHYMTLSQFNGITLTGSKPNYEKVSLVKGTDYTVQCFDSFGNEITDLEAENIRIYSYKITFADNETIKLLSDIEIVYESIGVISDTMAVGESVIFNNKAEFNSIYADASYTETKKEALKKYDDLNWGQSETTHNTTELTKTESGDYILKWVIIANESNNYGSSDVELTDTLPTGVTFIENSAAFMKHNGSYYETASGMEIVYDADTNTVVFKVPGTVHGSKAFRIDYSVSVTENFILANKSGDSTSFANNVTDGTNTASQTQKISFPLITKTGSDPDETYDGDISYTIDINPYALDLSDTDTITITDLLPHYSKKDENGNFVYGWGFSATLVNLKVLDAKTNKELAPSEYRLTYSDEEINTVNNAKFIAELPDERHLKIHYIYHLSANSSGGYIGRVENTAYIDYGIGSQESYYQNNYDLEKESNAHTATSDYIRIYKVDSENYAIRLGGAEFNLYQWQESSWQPLLNQSKKEDGSIKPTWGTESDTPLNLVTEDTNGSYLMPELKSGVLYKLIEIKAPENYVPRTAPYYFVLNSIPSDLPEGVQIAKIATLLKGGIINVENTPMTNVEMKVNKHWGADTSSQPVDVQLLVSESPPDLPKTITVNITDSKEHFITKKFNVNINSDIELTIDSLDAWWYNSGDFYVNDVNCGSGLTVQDGPWKGPDSTEFVNYIKYALGSVTGNTIINVKYKSSENHSQYKIHLTNCTEVSEGDVQVIKIPSDAVPVVNNPTVTLNEANNWTYTWTDLPQCKSDGTMYYYYVKELTEINGYAAEYDTNGINGGEINITNRMEAQKPTLPETGGNGMQRIFITGLILMIVPALCYLINRRKKKC